MTPAGAEILLIGILAGFFISRVMQQFTAERTATFDEQSYAQLEKAVEAALERRLAAGGVVAAAPAATATATAVAKPSTATDQGTETAVEEAPAEEAADAPGVAEGEVVTMKVTTIDGETHTLEVNSGENMLDAALDRGVDLEYSCKDGGCDTCTVRVLAGMEYLEDIKDEERDMLSEEELAAGNRLSCILHVRGPIEFVQEER